MPAGGHAQDLALLEDLLAVARSIELAAKDRGASPTELAPLRAARRRLREAQAELRGEVDPRSGRALVDEAIASLGAVLNAADAAGAFQGALTRSLRERRARWAEAKGRAA